MRWEDERYVRVYTRDTVDWLGLSFIAQGLFCLLLRKVDRAGLLPLGKHGKRAVAVAIGHPGDWSRLELALEELLSDGCVRIESDMLVIPNFIEAQEAIQSDAQRKRESRGRARDKAAFRSRNVTEPSTSTDIPDKKSRNVTECHETGKNVTCGHARSHAVTPSLAVPSRDDLIPPTPLKKNGAADEADSAAAAWAVLAPALRSRVRQEWLDQLEPAFCGGDLVLYAPSTDIAEHLQTNHGAWVVEHAPELLHLTGTVRFEAAPLTGGV